MKKKYFAPTLSAEIIYITDSMCASKEQCVGYDNVSDTSPSGIYGEGYVYNKGGQLYYCYGFGD